MYLPKLQKLKPLKKKKKLKRPVKKYNVNVGDTVRVSFVREPFKRFYDEQWSRETFTVVSRNYKRGKAEYKLKDYANDPVAGTFYDNELQKVIEPDDREYIVEKVLKTKGKGKNKEHLVRWLGWPNKFNSWIPDSELKDISSYQ